MAGFIDQCTGARVTLSTPTASMSERTENEGRVSATIDVSAPTAGSSGTPPAVTAPADGATRRVEFETGRSGGTTQAFEIRGPRSRVVVTYAIEVPTDGPPVVSLGHVSGQCSP